MKVALVHDYLNEFGGAERVLLALSEIWPDAPIYTAFFKDDSEAYERFKHKKIITSWAQNVPFFASYLHSPLRFLAPLIWNRWDFSDFDVVISSSSWYVTKGFKSNKQQAISNKKKFVEICYCHTPPRYLYGYATARKYSNPLVSLYALLVNHYMRLYDYDAAQRVDYFIANSKDVQARIKKFYRRDSVVIYPPVGVERLQATAYRLQQENRKVAGSSRSAIDKGYFLVVSRLVGAKGLELAVETMTKLKLPLKVVGRGAGYSVTEDELKRKAGKSVEFLGYVSDLELAELYRGARAFLALSKDEDFGITPVEAMMCGTPVIAYKGGGYKETVVDRRTGILVGDLTVGSLTMAIGDFVDMEKKGLWKSDEIKKHAQKFSKERFKKEILEFVKSEVK